MDAVLEQDCLTTLEANRLPKATWHRLGMNSAFLDVPADGRAGASAISVEAPRGVRMHECEVGIRTCEVGIRTCEAGRYLRLDGAQDPALDGSAFGRALQGHGFEGSFETGMGPQAASWLSNMAARHVVVEFPAGFEAHEAVVVHIAAQDAACAVVQLDVLAAAGSRGRLVIEACSPTAGSGFVGSLVRVRAGAGAHLEIDQMQALDATWSHVADMGIAADDDATVCVRQSMLGAGKTYGGLAASLDGHGSACEVDTRYLGMGAAMLDFNYIMRQRGQATSGKLVASGILAGNSHKTLRGTIDFVHGCKGSRGRELETVLLANEQVECKTIPVILCDEDDVQGDHGATIGHVGPAQLVYMESRGLSVEQIEALFASSAFDHARAWAYDTYALDAIDRLEDSSARCGRHLGANPAEEG